jgi:RHS repeat-associated protein
VWRNGSGGLAGQYYYYYYYYDGSGNVLGLVQGNGTQRAAYAYEPFGGHDTATGVNGSLPNNPFRFASGYTVFSNSSNHALLYKFGQRYYQPDQGRWTQPDSVDHSSDPAQADRYVYVGDDPLNNLDPQGTVSLTGLVNDVVGGIVGTVTGVACDASTLGIGRIGCGLIGGATGIVVTEGLNSLDEDLESLF